jgi:hypothetical protein
VEHVIVYLQQDKKRRWPPEGKECHANLKLGRAIKGKKRGGESEFFFSSQLIKKQNATAVERGGSRGKRVVPGGFEERGVPGGRIKAPGRERSEVHPVVDI